MDAVCTPRVSVLLLGTFEVRLDGRVVTAFESDKARALLAYLMVESHAAHRRQKLAGLLWPESPERKARRNLSQTLSRLRAVIGDRSARSPCISVSPQAIGFDRSAAACLDVARFSRLFEACRAHSHVGDQI